MSKAECNRLGQFTIPIVEESGLGRAGGKERCVMARKTAFEKIEEGLKEALAVGTERPGP